MLGNTRSAVALRRTRRPQHDDDDYDDRAVRCRWPVAVAGGSVRWPVSGGRCPVRWPVSAWPVSGVRWPVAGWKAAEEVYSESMDMTSYFSRENVRGDYAKLPQTEPEVHP